MPRLTFDQITARRRQLVAEHGLKLCVNQTEGWMYGPQPYADEYNHLASIHGRAPRG